MQGRGNMLTVYGHRGLPSKAPENTIASFKAASEVEGINWLGWMLQLQKMNN